MSHYNYKGLEHMHVNGPVMHPKNFKRLCLGGQTTPMFNGEYIPLESLKQKTVYIMLYSKSSQTQLHLNIRNR